MGAEYWEKKYNFLTDSDFWLLPASLMGWTILGKLANLSSPKYPSVQNGENIVLHKVAVEVKLKEICKVLRTEKMA